ncbi:MAG: Ig-like domain-containing protein [bacterium]
MNSISFKFLAALLCLLFLPGCETEPGSLQSWGKAWAWGKDTSGQCGNSRFFDSFTVRPAAVPGLHEVVAASGGRCHSLFLRADGTVWSLGCNSQGQLGDGSLKDRDEPVRVEGVTGAVAVACGENHSLALTREGKLLGWGANDAGQLGDATGHTQRFRPVRAYKLEGLKSVAGGDNHVLALGKDGSVYAFGENGHGQLGTGDEKDRGVPVKVEGLPECTAIAAAGHRSYVLTSRGMLFSFGRGQATNEHGRPSDSLVPQPMELPFRVKKVFAGGRRTLLVSESGDAYRLKKNSLPSLEKLSELPAVKEAALGYDHAVVLGRDKTVWVSGRNLEWQLGKERDTKRGPFQLAGLSGIVTVGAGWYHSLAVEGGGPSSVRAFSVSADTLKGEAVSVSLPVESASDLKDLSYRIISPPSSGTVKVSDRRLTYYPEAGFTGKDEFTWRVVANGRESNTAGVYVRVKKPQPPGTVRAWGSNFSGQLGDGAVIDRERPVRVKGISRVQEVSAGSMHSLALKKDGTVWGWGKYDLGQWAEDIDFHRPRRIGKSGFSCSGEGFSGVTAVHGDLNSSFAVRKDGTVWAWGFLPIRRGDDPVRVKGLDDAVKVSHGFALTRDGRVWSFGLAPPASPARLPGLENITDISGDIYLHLAADQQGDVFSWGHNVRGQLGRKTEDNHDEKPGKVPGLSRIKSVSAGYEHGLALDREGHVWSWGSNAYGQLGDGTTVSRRTPAKIEGLDHVAAISAGDYYSLALLKDGTVRAWGQNHNGQLGDGTNLARFKPVKVKGLCSVKAVEAANSHSLALCE